MPRLFLPCGRRYVPGWGRPWWWGIIRLRNGSSCHGFGPWLDTLALGRMCVPGLEDYSLSSLCGALGLTCSVEALLPARRWHDALYDALASLLIVRFLVKELNLSGQPLEVLGKAVRT